MTRILLIGNSHVAAWMLGWKEISARYPGVQIDVAAAGGRSFETITVVGDEIRKRDGSAFVGLTVGTTSFRLDHYSAVVIVGGTVSPATLLQLASGHLMSFSFERGPAAPRAEPFWKRLLHAFRRPDSSKSKRQTKPMVSDGFLLAACREIYGRKHGIVLANDIATRLPVPVFFASSPFPARDILKQEGSDAGSDKWIKNGKFLRAVYDVTIDAVLCRNVRVIRQPPETIEEHFFTLARFSKSGRAALRNDREGAVDHKHMNAEFGSVFLSAALAEILAVGNQAPPIPMSRQSAD